MSTVKTGVVGAGYVGTASCPLAGEKVTGASIQVVAQSVLNDAAFLNAVLTDGTHNINVAEIDSVTAVVTTLLQCSGTQTFTGITTVNGVMTIVGALVLGYTRRRALVYLTDADQTVDVTAGNTYIIATPAASRVITLRMTTAPIPVNGDWMRFAVTNLNGFVVTLKREGSPGSSVAAFTTNVAEAEVQMAGGVWRGCGGANYSYGPQW